MHSSFFGLAHVLFGKPASTFPGHALMDFSLPPHQDEIRAAIEKLCARFDADYWLAKDKDGGFPHDFHRAFADAGWLGICIPEEFGGAGLGITEAAVMMQA